MHIAATFQAIYYAMCQTVALYVALVEWFNHLVDLLFIYYSIILFLVVYSFQV